MSYNVYGEDDVSFQQSRIRARARALYVYLAGQAASAFAQALSTPVITFTGAPAAVGTTGDISFYQNAMIVISGLTVETIAINTVLNAVVGAPVTIYNNAGVAAAAAALGNGTYWVRLRDTRVDALNFVKSAAAEVVTINMRAYG